MLRILEIGSGSQPWFVRQLFLLKKIGPTPINMWVQDFITRPHEYHCVDNDPDAIEKSLAIAQRKDFRSLLGRVHYKHADAKRLPFGDETFGAVVCADLFSVPPFDYPGVTLPNPIAPPRRRERPSKVEPRLYPGQSDEDKEQILNEALRVLKPSGMLVFCTYQTPEHSQYVVDRLDELERQGKLKMLDGFERKPLGEFGEKLVREALLCKLY